MRGWTAAQQEQNRLHAAERNRLTGERNRQIFMEERTFLREICGFSDRQVAERLGYDWPSYRRIFLRHPELGIIDDPEETERKRWEEFNRALSVHAAPSRRSRRCRQASSS